MSVFYSDPIRQCFTCPSTRLQQQGERYGTEPFGHPTKIVLVTGRLICLDCDCSMLYTRRPTDTWPAPYGDILPPPAVAPPQKGLGMFKDRIGMILKNVSLGVETVDQETRRVVACTFEIDPFTSAHAAALAVQALLFDGTSKLPKQALDTVILEIGPLDVQSLSWGMGPNHDEGRITIPDVLIDRKLRVKLKTDREPAAFAATLTCNFRYPTADELLFIANGVKDQHFLKFTPMKATLFTDDAQAAGTAPPRPSRKRKADDDGAAAPATAH